MFDVLPWKELIENLLPKPKPKELVLTGWIGIGTDKRCAAISAQEFADNQPKEMKVFEKVALIDDVTYDINICSIESESSLKKDDKIKETSTAS